MNTALTRGKPVVRVAVIHPIESYWLHWGPVRQTHEIRTQMEERFLNLTEWLLFGGIDFDFISEALLPELCVDGSTPMAVGEMCYDTIIVPGCETLRCTTLERLERFAQTGGRLIFLGDAPKYVDALPSERGKALWEKSLHTSPEKSAVLDLMEEVRIVRLVDRNLGSMTDSLLHQLRRDGDCCWLMVAHGKEAENPDVPKMLQLEISIKGSFRPVLYDTLTGEQHPMMFRAEEGLTRIEADMWDADSLLIHLEPVQASECEPFTLTSAAVSASAGRSSGQRTEVPEVTKYAMSEPNVLLLDRAEYCLDQGEWNPEQEILRVCQEVRGRLGWPLATDVQPYVFGEEKREHQVILRFRIYCEQEIKTPLLATEQMEYAQIRLDGAAVEKRVKGWYVDTCIRTMELPTLCAGVHSLEIEYSVAMHTNLEWVYLLGNFAVKRYGRRCILTKLPEKIGYSSITEQGFPFYGGMMEYQIPFWSESSNIRVHIPHWRGVLMKVSVDESEEKLVAYPPYTCDFSLAKDAAASGNHTLYIRLFGHRGNAFGPVHLADEQETWLGPGSYRTRGDKWSEEYRLGRIGLLSAPLVENDG